MSTWDASIFAEEANVDFLDDLAELDDDDIVEAIRDACLLVVKQPGASEEDRQNGLAAATIAAIWAGAPFSAGEVAESYPYIRALVGSSDEELNAAAAELLEGVDTDADLDQFTEALT